jgi:RNA polymerase sigma-70 factor (ECF subfamily)
LSSLPLATSRYLQGDVPAFPQKLRLVHRSNEGDAVAVARRLDDTQLLAAIRAGDPRAATSLYERSRPIVDRTIRRLLGRPDQDQQDISQQVMVELVRSVDGYRGECPLDGWIATVAAHIVWKCIRKRRLERRVWVAEDGFEAEGSDQPAHNVMMRSIIRRVSRHLEAMDSTRAWAFLLHDVHGYDLREMAQIMEVSEAAAQSRLVRGRRDLHERIADDPELAGALAQREGLA